MYVGVARGSRGAGAGDTMTPRCMCSMPLPHTYPLRPIANTNSCPATIIATTATITHVRTHLSPPPPAHRPPPHARPAARTCVHGGGGEGGGWRGGVRRPGRRDMRRDGRGVRPCHHVRTPNALVATGA